MNSEELDEVEGLATELRIKSGWIYRNKSCPVYFYTCARCGSDFSARSNKAIYCTKECGQSPESSIPTGIIGVVNSRDGYRAYIEKRVNNVTKKRNLGTYRDFFEACCVRKSADNGIINGLPIEWGLKEKPLLEKLATVRSTNKTGISGVSYDKSKNKYTVSICYQGERGSLGLYSDFFEACCARKSAEANFGGHKTRKGILAGRPNELGIPGVIYYSKRNGKDVSLFVAKIIYNNKYHQLYYGEDFFEACCARKSAETILRNGGKVQDFKYVNKNVIKINPIDTRIKGVVVRCNRYVTTITTPGGFKIPGRFTDFFEACCARKSEDAKNGGTSISRYNLKGRNKTGLVGVTFTGRNNDKNDGEYVAALSYNKKRHELYRGGDFFEACCARKSADAEKKTGLYRGVKVIRWQKNTSGRLLHVGITYICGKRGGAFNARIMLSGRIYSLGSYDNYFDACCARKSAENSLTEEKPILRQDNKTGISGVHYEKRYNRYKVFITSSGEQIYLGGYKGLFEACCAKKSAEAQLIQGTFVN